MKKQCNFCGRSERDVRLMISGLNGYICEDCAQQAYQIVQENLAETQAKNDLRGPKGKLKVPKPREI